ncbi:MAG: molybdopterin-synthase adenylyltransferase MoeB, partial [Gammaproteobacteria bacterium]|nr:molybdopterin-synthase adenylyltransferase MoeB [Gammaproteobacteria bacterium]
AKASVAAINPGVEVEAIAQRIGGPGLVPLLNRVDLVVDATDNFSTRFALNDACWHSGTPLVSGAAIRWEGQVAVFDPRGAASPCYRCLYADGSGEALNCAENGVIAPLVGVVGAMQAMEAVKLITGVGDPLTGRVLYYDAKRAEWRAFKLAKRPGCQTCE